MAKKETPNQPKDLIEAVPEEIAVLQKDPVVAQELKSFQKFRRREFDDKEIQKERLLSWVPKTALGRDVKEGREKNIDSIFESGRKIMEAEIVDTLLNLENDLLLIGQAKGKFGGGKRRAWRQTQKKTMEGNVLSFSSMAIVGDKKGHVGIGLGKSKETLPSREKALRNAKLNIIKVTLGFENPESPSSEPHTIPFKVEGKCGSTRITLWPAPRGTGLVAGDECKKILRLVGVKDVYSKTFGSTRTTFNLAQACVDALKKTNKKII